MKPTKQYERSALASDKSIAGDSINAGRAKIQRVGLVAGPCLAAMCYLMLPVEYSDSNGQAVDFETAGRATLAVMAWMATWWLTECIDLSATALLPLVVFPLFGIANMVDTAAPYAHPLIFLFMGGFIQALSMRRWGLDQRIALVTLRLVGTKPVNMVAGFMIVTAVLSAFVSNTATAALMLPIALSVVALTNDNVRRSRNKIDDPIQSVIIDRNLTTCLMLGIAYAASIGGVATIIGTPPNVFLVSFLSDSISEPHRMEMSFSRWMLIGVPFAVVFLPIVWLLLTRVIFPIRTTEIKGGKQLIESEYLSLGPPSRGEWITFVVFCSTALVWIIRPLLAQIHFDLGDRVIVPFASLTDSGIAMAGALTLFVIPTGSESRKFVMNWDTANQMPWSILILFGGGISLAAAVEANGVAEFIGSQARYAAGIPDFILVLLVCLGIIFLTELTSNTATAATLLPVLAALAPGLGVHPYLLIFPAAIAASCAFMLPVATPPNAIVFASRQVTIPQMVKAGIWLNLVAVVLATLLTFLVVAPLMGVK